MSGVTLAHDFDQLCDVLEDVEFLARRDVRDAVDLVIRTAAELPLDSELRVWWLVAARFTLEGRLTHSE